MFTNKVQKASTDTTITRVRFKQLYQERFYQ